jgi:hypothetical protein
MKPESGRICAAENREKYCRRSVHDKGEEGERRSQGKERKSRLMNNRPYASMDRNTQQGRGDEGDDGDEERKGSRKPLDSR